MVRTADEQIEALTAGIAEAKQATRELHEARKLLRNEWKRQRDNLDRLIREAVADALVALNNEARGVLHDGIDGLLHRLEHDLRAGLGDRR